ncbi:GFA family protein [Neptuniibacter caesariensis]|uniref:CENP-V/GFA domain-containing protein n=1 Tax=Neptuniibacter caesariensis TaxID=207954 RepID=A0A7U8C3L3_NEPCE|nr:GFA family protein [Neptuniibacter caesariensis]EAR59829.1 hypothetical protein MED92_12616 [Neptuniibacter caesariensis]
MSSSSLKGSCLCGAIKYEVTSILPQMAHCHCTMCRKFHGAAFATFGVARSADFKWLQGKEKLKTYRADNGAARQFCEDCGSSLTFAASDCDGLFVEFSLGTLDSPLAIKPDAHIYCRYKADWYEPNDALPKFPEGRDSSE